MKDIYVTINNDKKIIDAQNFGIMINDTTINVIDRQIAEFLDVSLLELITNAIDNKSAHISTTINNIIYIIEFRYISDFADHIGPIVKMSFYTRSAGYDILENVQVCLIIADYNMVISHINEYVYNIFGYIKTELIGQNVTMLMPEEIAKDHDSYVNRYKSTGNARIIGVKNRIVMGRHKDGHLIELSMTVNKHYNEINEPYFLASFTQLNRYFDKHYITFNDIAKYNSSFVSNISHELRTPINGIYGMLDMIKETTLTELQKYYVNMCYTSAENLIKILDDVMIYTKSRDGCIQLSISSFDLNEIIEDTVSLAYSHISKDKNINIVHYIHPDVKHNVLGDRKILIRILNHIIENAIKFTSVGSIEIEVYAMQFDIIKFSISDTGIGMTQEQLTELFQPYTQIDSGVNKKYVGTGLGLSICKLLVQLAGGEIYATSKLGRGSTFVFTMKLEQDKNKIYDKYEHVHIGKRICIVDDNAINCMTLDSVLTRFNFVVKTFRSPVDALNHLKLCKLENNQYDLIIMDYHMHPMNGLEVVKHIEEYGIPTDVIMLTSVLSHNRIKFSTLTQCSSRIKYCLYKPIVSKQLYEILIKYFDGIFESNILSDMASQPVQPDLSHQISHTDMKDNKNDKHILIVDDNTMNRNIMHIILEKYNYITHDASNGLEAIEKIKQNNKYFAIFMDIHMPVLNGLDATEKIIASGYIGPIIALTADVTLEMSEKINNIGFYDSIYKPVTVDKLLNVLNSVKNIVIPEANNCDNVSTVTSDICIPDVSEVPTINIIVVDDNNVNTIIFYKYLEMVEKKLGISITKTKFINGKELCDYYLSDSRHDIVDCIFMDIEMPVMNGYQATIKIKEHDKHIRIIGLTGHDELYHRDLFSGVILKPISIENTEREIQNILDINKSRELEKYININIVNGLKNIGEDTLTRIINQWCKDLDERKNSINAKLGAKDFKGIHFDAHYVKGASYQIGCSMLGDLFGELEQLALNENIDTIADIIAKINKYHTQSIISIKKVYNCVK